MLYRLSMPDIGEEELDEIRKVFDTKILVQGDFVQEFEQMICRYLNVKHAIAVSSGTSALHLALLALNIGKDDEVIVPDFTFPATANVVELVGANVKVVDIDITTFCIDVKKIERNISKNTKAIIPVHEFGYPAKMDEIISIAQKYNLKIIEDAACGLGSEYKGQKVGSFGHISCFSFHPRKNITTGEGGVVVTNYDDIAEKIRILRNHGIQYKDNQIDFIIPGFNYRMTNIQGAIGKIQMKKIDNIINNKELIAKKYIEMLSNNKLIVTPKFNENIRHNWQTFYIIFNDSLNRNEIIKRLKLKGIETNYGAYSIHQLEYYKNKYKFNSKQFKNSSKAYFNGLALPLYYGMTFHDVNYIVNSLLEVINEQYK